MSTIGWSGFGRTAERTSKWLMRGRMRRRWEAAHFARHRALSRPDHRPALHARNKPSCRQALVQAGFARRLRGMDTPFPTLFLSHGSPMLAVQDSAAGRFLDGLGKQLPTPRAIVVASA